MTTTSPFDLTGMTVLVTGASRGIGLAIARSFLLQDANVVIGGHDAAETEVARAALTAEFPGIAGQDRVAALAGDISEPVVVEALVAEGLGSFGKVDSVVCNAGIDIIKPAVDYTVSEWERILAVNLRGAFLVAQKVAQGWIGKSQRGGSITFTSSIAGSTGIAKLAPYAASKGGINQIVRTLAVEWAEYGIRVNAIAPGYVANIMSGVREHDDPSSEDRIRRLTPLGRRATVEEIAMPYVFLASSAASYITGAVLAVDGGYTAL